MQLIRIMKTRRSLVCLGPPAAARNEEDAIFDKCHRSASEYALLGFGLVSVFTLFLNLLTNGEKTALSINMTQVGSMTYVTHSTWTFSTNGIYRWVHYSYLWYRVAEWRKKKDTSSR